MQQVINKAAIIGGGVIGAGWISRFLENGIDVNVYDPAPEAARNIKKVLGNAERAFAKLTLVPRRTPGNLHLSDSLEDAVSKAQIIVESVPERLDVKQAVYAEIEKFAPQDAIISSSTSGILPSQLQSNMQFPGRLLVAHPFNPVYLLPVVELVGGEQTTQATLARAATFYQGLGMFPLAIKTEIEAFIADRLLEAVWREALWLVKDDVATTQDIDDAIRLGFGLRWAQMGLFETYRIAGGEAGMRHFLKQFGPCLKWPWSKLTDVPDLDEALIEKISLQSDEQSGALSIRELEQQRDDNLVLILQALKKNNWGAGQILSQYEDQLTIEAKFQQQKGGHDIRQVLETVERIVPEDWTDYNGHMNESRYLECFSEATDELMQIIGVDDHYLEHTGSYFTVETHIQHKGETKAGQTVRVSTQLLSVEAKKLHLFHRLELLDGSLLATGEHMLIHVNLNSRRSSEAGEKILSRAREIACGHAKLPLPAGPGRAIGQAPE